MLRRYIAFGLLLLFVAGCTREPQGSGGASGSGEGGEKKHRIAVIPKGTTNEFWKSVHAGADNAAKELGNVEVLWKGPLLEDDRDPPAGPSAKRGDVVVADADRAAVGCLQAGHRLLVR